VSRALFVWLARAVGAGLIVLVLWLVGWEDRVTGVDGTEHRGRVVSRGPDGVVLRTEAGDERIAVEDERGIRQGLLTTFATLVRRPLWALLALGLQLLGLLVTVGRWRLLLGGADLPTPYPTACRLAWIALFSANLLPGGTAGGDVVRAAWIAKEHPGRKARAVLSVFADRAVGLLALCAIAVAALLAAPAGARFEAAGKLVAGVAAAGGVAALLFFSPRVRGLLGPVLHDAFTVYARRPALLGVAALLALVAHALVLTAYAAYGRALGEPLPWMAILVAVPVAQMLQAVPGLPGGWGVGEFAFWFFLPAAGVPAGQAVALSVTGRLAYALLSLPGGLMLAKPRSLS